MLDLATRAHNHNFNMDPIVRTLFDTDFYKYLMLQFVWKHEKYRNYPITFALINRDHKKIQLGKIISFDALKEQLDHARCLRFNEDELIWLHGQTFYGVKGMFEPAFIEWLRNYQLPEYYLQKTQDDNYILEFTGGYADAMLWEIYALTIVGGLKTRAGLKKLSKLDLKILYARWMNKLYEKLIQIRDAGVENVTDFSTRRRHDFLSQLEAVLMARDVLGPLFTGTSNVHIAHKWGIPARGTNAHELQMVEATFAETDEALLQSQYVVPKLWREYYGDVLSMLLPDTFGTTQFLMNAPDWVADGAGIRFDSKNPISAGEEAICWWQQKGRDPRTKLALFSDGLDVEEIIRLHNHFKGRVRLGFGWGTLFANDFRGCSPVDVPELNPISLVCKIQGAGDKPAVKLSDNYNKATGNPDEIARYRRVFGTAGVAGAPVVV